MIISVVGGSGAIGTALGARLAAAGHSIVLASRDPAAEKVQAAKNQIASAARLPGTVSALGIRESCDKSDAVLISTPGIPAAEGMVDLAASMGPCAGKPLVDCTNPLSPYPELEIVSDRNTTSATEELAKVFPECGGVYKAFNIVGVAILSNPVMENGEKATMFYAGPSRTEAESAFDKVTTIMADVGFEPCYVGGPRQARNLESLAEMWMHMALRYKDLPYKENHDPPGFAWKILFR